MPNFNIIQFTNRLINEDYFKEIILNLSLRYKLMCSMIYSLKPLLF